MCMTLLSMHEEYELIPSLSVVSSLTGYMGGNSIIPQLSDQQRLGVLPPKPLSAATNQAQANSETVRRFFDYQAKICANSSQLR